LDRFVTLSNLGVIWIIVCSYEDERQVTAILHHWNCWKKIGAQKRW
jgi:hypothetical protein